MDKSALQLGWDKYVGLKSTKTKVEPIRPPVATTIPISPRRPPSPTPEIVEEEDDGIPTVEPLGGGSDSPATVRSEAGTPATVRTEPPILSPGLPTPPSTPMSTPRTSEPTPPSPETPPSRRPVTPAPAPTSRPVTPAPPTPSKTGPVDNVLYMGWIPGSIFEIPDPFYIQLRNQYLKETDPSPAVCLIADPATNEHRGVVSHQTGVYHGVVHRLYRLFLHSDRVNKADLTVRAVSFVDQGTLLDFGRYNGDLVQYPNPPREFLIKRADPRELVSGTKYTEFQKRFTKMKKSDWFKKNAKVIWTSLTEAQKYRLFGDRYEDIKL